MLLLGDAMLQTGKNKEAAAVLARYVPVAKKDAGEARFKLALAQLRAGDEPSAEQNLKQLMDAGGDSPWLARALFEYGQLQFTKKRHDRAAEALRKVVAANAPEELAAPAAYMLAWIDLDTKKYAEAASGFEAVAAKYPKHALTGDATYQRAVALREAGQAEKAAEVFDAYLKTYPEGPHVAGARQTIASSLNKAGKPQEAVKMLAALAADAKTRSDSVLYELAWARRNASDEASAMSAYQQLLEQYPQSKLIHAARAELGDLLFKQGQFADAAQQLEKVVDAQGLDLKTLAVARYRLGSAYEKLKEPKKAAAAFARFVKDHPDDELAPSAMYQAAEASIAAGRLTDAQQHLSQLVKKGAKGETATVAMLKLGEVQAELGDHAAAAQTYQDFLTNFSNDKFAYLAQFGVGWALENQKKYDEARKAYEKVTATHNGPTAARAQFQIGETYFAQGKFEDAVKALLAVEDVYGKTEWTPRALYEAGRALEQLKQPDKAKQQYAAVVEKYKDAPEAALAQKALKAIGG
jgi:TolA-binding protein